MKQSNDEKTGWWRCLTPRPIDGVTSLLYVGVVIIFGYFYSTGMYPNALPGWLSGIIILTTILVLLALDRIEFWRYNDNLPARVLALFLIGRIILIILASLSDGFGLPLGRQLWVLFIPFGILFLFGGSYGLSGHAWVLYLLARLHAVYGDKPPFKESDFIFFLILGLTFIFIISMAYLTRREKQSRWQTEQLLHELKESHQQLHDYADRVAELATIEERNRLAREIHDSLGHYMTVINVQLEKAMAFRERNPHEADQAIKDAKHLASEALKDIRHSVGALRSSPEFSLAQSLQELVDHMKSDQFEIELQIQGEETGFSKQSLQTLYRATQEGLTNVQKHAKAKHATIRIQLEDEQASLTIDDDGQGFDFTNLEYLKEKSHYGLQGIRERLELIRGSFRLESRPDQGTQLCVTVPKNPLALVNRPGNR